MLKRQPIELTPTQKLVRSQQVFIANQERLQNSLSNVPSVNDRIQKLKPIHCMHQFKKSVKLKQAV